MATPQFKQLKRSYGINEAAIVPGDVPINPDQTTIDLKITDFDFVISILATAMDGVKPWPAPNSDTTC